MAEIATWGERFGKTSRETWGQFLAPETLAKTSVPASIILGCGAIDAFITGFNPIGFGAGSLVGNWLTGEMKSGAAADKLADLQDRPDDIAPKVEGDMP